MDKYHHSVDNYRRGRRSRRLRRVLVGILLFIIVAATGAAVYVTQQIKDDEPAAVATKREDLGYYSGTPRKVYDNEVFRFESAKDWSLSRGDSSIPSKYVFFSSKNNIVQYELIIYASKTPPETNVNYIMPVTVANNKIMPQRISPKCVFPSSVKADYVMQKFQDVKFNCSNSPSREIVAIGVVGDSYDVPLYTPKGAVKNIGVQFVDHTANPYEQVLSEIVSSFKLN